MHQLPLYLHLSIPPPLLLFSALRRWDSDTAALWLGAVRGAEQDVTFHLKGIAKL